MAEWIIAIFQLQQQGVRVRMIKQRTLDRIVTHLGRLPYQDVRDLIELIKRSPDGPGVVIREGQK